ncbi:MAG: DUF1963 domain-containing protein [Patulibacter minatonensis]
MPDEQPLSNDDLNAVLNGVLEAYWRAVQTAATREPVRIDLDGPPAPDGRRRLLPGVARIAGASGPDELIELRPHCDADTLVLCDRVNADLLAARPDHPLGGTEIVDTLAPLLAGELNEHDPALARTYPGAEQAVPTYVHFGQQSADELARMAMGEGWMAAHDPAEGRRQADRDAALEGPEAPPPPDARRDRAALAAWLERRGLRHAERIAHEMASPGFRLVRHADGQPRPRTRIGGPGALPPGVAWPTTGPRHRPLDLLAIVDLAELEPTVPGGAPMPHAGCLLFYADLGPEQPASGDAPHTYGWFGEPTPNEEGAGARVLWVEPGDDPVEAAAPRRPESRALALPSYRVARQELVLFDTDPIGVSLGFDDHLQYRPLEDASFALRSDGSPGWVRTDWVLGGAVNVDALGEAGVPNPALLLRLDSVDLQDAGSIEFRIPFDALARGDWAQAFAVGESA